MFRRLQDLDSRELKMLAVLTSLLLIILIILSFIKYSDNTVTLYLDNTARAPEYNATRILVPSEGTRTIQLDMDRITAVSMQSVSINNVCVFESSEVPGRVRIENKPDSNRATTVEIVRLDNNQTIMTTGLIDPGYFVEYRRLDVPLAKGTYVCAAKFTLYDTYNNTIIGHASTQIVVIIES